MIVEVMTSIHEPLSGCRVPLHAVHCVGKEHSVQLEGHASHRPAAMLPYWPEGQKVAQMPVGSKKGRLPPTVHAVQASRLYGREHAAHALWHASQCVPLLAKPAGHLEIHSPR